MLANQGQAASAVTMVAAVSAGNTAAATSAWIDVRPYEGDLVIVSNIGIITGTITPTIEDATDGAGAGAAEVVPAQGAFTPVTTSNDPMHEKRTIPAGSVRGWIRYAGTIVTGPAPVAVTLLAHPKYT